MKRKIAIPFLVVLLIALDQAVKYYIVSNFSLGQVRKFIPKIVSLTYLRNTGKSAVVFRSDNLYRDWSCRLVFD